jgi:hypothetical protein
LRLAEDGLQARTGGGQAEQAAFVAAARPSLIDDLTRASPSIPIASERPKHFRDAAVGVALGVISLPPLFLHVVVASVLMLLKFELRLFDLLEERGNIHSELVTELGYPGSATDPLHL